MTQYLEDTIVEGTLTNTGTAGLILSHGTDEDVTIISLPNVDGTPSWIWDESESMWASNVGLFIASDIKIASGSITSASGTISFNDEILETTGTLASGTHTVSSALVLASGSITDSSGTITFVDENLNTTGTGTFGQIIDSGLTASLGVYTDGSKQLTSTPPDTGILGHWDRTGTVLSPSHAGDDIVTTGGRFAMVTDSSDYNDYVNALSIGATNPLHIHKQTGSVVWMSIPTTGLRMDFRSNAGNIGIGASVLSGTRLRCGFSTSSGSGNTAWYSNVTSGAGNKVTVRGLQNTVGSQGSGGTISELTAANNQVEVASSGETITLARGTTGRITAFGGHTSPIITGLGFEATINAEDTTITNAVNYYGRAPLKDAGTITTFSHIWLEDATVAGTNWGIVLDSDTLGIHFGAGQDVKLYYNGTVCILQTDVVAASDFQVDCGTEKTLVLVEPVYKDINIGAATLSGPPGLQPSVDNFLDEAGADTGIATSSLSVAQGFSGNFEMQHDWKEGTDITFHVHWQGIAAPSGTDNVQWRLTYSFGVDDDTLDAVTIVDSADTPFDTQYEFMRTDVVTISPSTRKIGNQFLFTLERVLATGDAYAGDALVATVGIHYQVDTLGSRQVGIK